VTKYLGILYIKKTILFFKVIEKLNLIKILLHKIF